MTIKQFLNKIEKYYEQIYSEGKVDILGGYFSTLEKEHDLGPIYRGYLLAEVMRTFSGQYKTLPDIAIFEKCQGDAVEKMAHELKKRKATDFKQIEERTVPIEEVQRFFDDFMEMIKGKKE